MYQPSPLPGISSLPRIDQLGLLTETGSEIPSVAKIEPRPRLPPEFRRSLSRYAKDKGSKVAINWYQTQLTAREVKHRDTAGLTRLEEILRRDFRIAIASNLPRWVAKKTLGKGKYGQVVLWERNMGTNEPPEHVACKDSKFDSWFKDYCIEANLTLLLNATGCVNVVKVFDWMTIRTKQINRILYEYCPHGTLYDLYSFYKRECKVTIPEAFLWHVFHSLATVICYHAYGTTDGGPSPDWIEIVHRDVKPQNILLSDPELDNRNLYPTLKLADYGLAYSIPNDEIRRLKRTMWTGGTAGYVAPEANGHIRDDPVQTPYPIASHLSDIYSIGCTILDFLRLPISRYSKSSWELLDLDLDFTYEYYPYSRDLVDLARECVKPDPKDRPSAIALYHRTRRHAEESYDLVEKVSQAHSSMPGTAFAGQMLWNKTMQERYKAIDQFRNVYKNANDWSSTHSYKMRKLDEVAMTPREDAIPPSGHVALGNGLGGFCNLALLKEEFAGVPVESYLATMKVYDASGRELVRKDEEPILRFLGQDRLIALKPNLEWRQSNITQQAVRVKRKREERDKVRDEEIAEQAITRKKPVILDEAGGGFPGQLMVQPRVPQDSRQDRSRYQQHVAPAEGSDGRAHGREWPKSPADPTVGPNIPLQTLHQGPAQRPLRANDVPQDEDPRLARRRERNVTRPGDVTTTTRILRPRKKGGRV